MNFAARLIAAATLGAAALTVSAQTFPSKTVTIVVPFTAGGPTDTVARSLGQGMTKSLGQTVVVENVTGAGGTIGAARVKAANPDGYTVLLHHIGMSTAPALYRKLGYDPLKDFEMVGLVVDVPMTLVARSDFPAANLPEMLTYVKANKAKMNLANAGIGSASHLCGLLFQSAIETDIVTVPFKGTADALNALLGKQVDLLCDQTTNTTAQIAAGGIKAYGVTSRERVSTLANVATLREGGLKDFEIGVWHGIYAPKGTPKPVIDKLVAAVQAAAQEPDFRKRMADLGASVYPADRITPAALNTKLASEIDKWTPIIRKAGVYAD